MKEKKALVTSGRSLLAKHPIATGSVGVLLAAGGYGLYGVVKVARVLKPPRPTIRALVRPEPRPPNPWPVVLPSENSRTVLSGLEMSRWGPSVVDEILEAEAIITLYAFDGSPIRPSDPVSESAVAVVRERGGQILKDVLDKIPDPGSTSPPLGTSQLEELPTRESESLRNSMDKVLKRAEGDPLKPYKFEWKAPCKLILPFEKEILRGKVSLGEINVCVVAASIVAVLRGWRKVEIPPPQRRHEVRRGDTLWEIAEQYYDDGAKWELIAKANEIARPNSLPVGSTLVIPSQPE